MKRRIAMSTPRWLAAVLLALSIVAPGGALAQTPATPPAAAAAPAANPADVASIDAILGALYDVISGPAGKKRDWDRMRSLFAPGGRLVPTGKRPTGELVSRVIDVEGYVASSGPYLEKEGFFEREV